MPDLLADATADYLASVDPPADDLVLEMEADADRHGIPIADRSVATLQAILARATGADRALEFGTATGYSALHVARTGTDVVTTEVDADRIAAAVDYLERDGIPVRVTDDPTTVAPDPAGEGRVVVVEAVVVDVAGQRRCEVEATLGVRREGVHEKRLAAEHRPRERLQEAALGAGFDVDTRGVSDHRTRLRADALAGIQVECELCIGRTVSDFVLHTGQDGRDGVYSCCHLLAR